MPATYTPLLRLTKPGLGDTGWGTTVNDGTTELVDTSVAGTASVDVTSGNVTLSTANGATDQARNMFLRVFGASVAREVIVPATSKLYFVVNECTAAVTVKVSGQTGVAIPASSTAVVRCNGTDVVTSLNYAPSLTLGAALAAASGGTGQASYTTGDLLYATGATALSKLGIGTNGQILTSTGTAPQWSTLSGVAVTTFSAGTTGFTPNSATSGAVTLAGTLATTNGGTGLTSFTSGGVLYASSTSALATGSALTFDGTNFVVGGAAVFGKSTVINSLSGTAAALGISDNATTTMYANNVSSGVSALWSSGALAFGTNNGTFSEQMRLNSTGLGIGTSSPQAKLQVLNQIKVSDSTQAQGALVLGDGGSTSFNVGIARWNGSTNTAGAGGLGYFSQGTANSGGHYWYTGDAQAGSTTLRATLDSSGNLGIGTSSPGTKLDVVGTIKATAAQGLLLDNSVGVYATIQYNGTSIGDIGTGNQVYSGGTTTDLGISARTGYRLVLGSNGVAQATLDSSGNLGIGTNNPTTKLDVSANGGMIQLSGTSGNNLIQVSTGSGTTGIGLWAGGASRIYSTGNMVFSVNSTLTTGAPSPFSDAMTLDSSGNLGLGVTPSAWGSQRALEFAYGGLSIGTSIGVELVANTYWNGTNWIYRASSTAQRYEQDSNGHKWYTAPSGTAGNPMTGANAFVQVMTVSSDGTFRVKGAGTAGSTDAVQFSGSAPASAMTLDASGRLLVGRTTNFAGEALQIDANGVGSTVYSALIGNSSTSTAAYNTMRFAQGASGSATGYLGTGGSTVGNPSFQNTFVVGTQSSHALVFNTNDTERARITSGGSLCVGTTSSGYRLGVTTNSGSGVQVITAGATLNNPSQDWYDTTNLTEATLTTGNALISFGAYSNTPLAFITNNTERARITSGGNFVLGSGEGTATPSSFNYFRAPDAAGTNIAGAGLFINAGNGTGTGGSGSIYLQTAKADSSGSSANSMATVLEITPEGNAKFGPVLGQNYVSANGDFRLQNTSYLRIGHGDATNGIVGGYNIYLSSGTPKYENTSGSSPLSGIYYKSDGTLNFYTGPSASGNTNATERAKIPANGGMVVGTAALATTATDGFLYVPTCAGAPTGTPTTQTGTAPIVVDTTNNKLYFYSGGQWRDAGP